MWAVLSPFPSKREGDGSLFCALTRRKFFFRLSMISWGQFYVTERYCDFLKRLNLLIKILPWLTFFLSLFISTNYKFVNFGFVNWRLFMKVQYFLAEPGSALYSILEIWIHLTGCLFVFIFVILLWYLT